MILFYWIEIIFAEYVIFVGWDFTESQSVPLALPQTGTNLHRKPYSVYSFQIKIISRNTVEIAFSTSFVTESFSPLLAVAAVHVAHFSCTHKSPRVSQISERVFFLSYPNWDCLSLPKDINCSLVSSQLSLLRRLWRRCKSSLWDKRTELKQLENFLTLTRKLWTGPTDDSNFFL